MILKDFARDVRRSAAKHLLFLIENKKQILRSAQDDMLGGFFSSLLVARSKKREEGESIYASCSLLLAPCFSQMFVQAKLSLGGGPVSRSRIHLSETIVRSREIRINSDGPAVFRDGI